MFYSKTMRAIDAYYKLKTFNAEKEIKNNGLRHELLNKQIFIYSDGYTDHYSAVEQIIEDPQLFKLKILEKAIKYIEEYKHFDNIVADKLKIISLDDDPTYKNKKN